MRIAAAIAAPLLAVAGALLLIVGVVQQQKVDGAYVIAFVKSGDDCGTARPLFCGPPGVVWTDREVEVTGVTGDQIDEILGLAAQLGADGLAENEQRFLQTRSHEIESGGIESPWSPPGPGGGYRAAHGCRCDRGRSRPGRARRRC